MGNKLRRNSSVALASEGAGGTVSTAQMKQEVEQILESVIDLHRNGTLCLANPDDPDLLPEVRSAQETQY